MGRRFRAVTARSSVAATLAVFVLAAGVTGTAPASPRPALPGLTDASTPTSTSIGGTAQLVAQVPAIGTNGTSIPMSTEIIQSFDPTVVQITGASDVVAPDGWVRSYSTDGITFTPTPVTWAGIRAVKATGSVVSEGVRPNAGGVDSQIASQSASMTSALAPGLEFATPEFGDGYIAFFDPAHTRVFNIFHHLAPGNQSIDCHDLITGLRCDHFPMTVDFDTNNFSYAMIVKTKMWIPSIQTASPHAIGFYCIELADVLASGGSPAMCSTPFVAEIGRAHV